MNRLFLLFAMVLVLVTLSACGNEDNDGSSSPIAPTVADNAGPPPATAPQRISLDILKQRLPCLSGTVEHKETSDGTEFVTCPLDPSKSKAQIAVYSPFDDIKTIMIAEIPHGSLEDIKPDLEAISQAIVAICASGQVTDIETWIADGLRESDSDTPEPTHENGIAPITAENRERTIGGISVQLNASSLQGGSRHIIQVIIGQDLAQPSA